MQGAQRVFDLDLESFTLVSLVLSLLDLEAQVEVLKVTVLGLQASPGCLNFLLLSC